MSKTIERGALLLTAAALYATTAAETTVTQTQNGLSVDQTTPHGAVGHQQVLIIDIDEHGNRQVFSAGGDVRITKPLPCRRDRPTERMDCSGEDLRAVRWDGRRLAGGTFDGADLRGASLVGAALQNSSLNGVDLQDADLTSADLANCDMNEAHLGGAVLAHARLTNCDLNALRAAGASFARAELSNSDLVEADLRGADLRGARLDNVDLDDAALDSAVWPDGRTCGYGSRGDCR
jgi:uncharacterized protein YjbI with pentapeptide repeats